MKEPVKRMELKRLAKESLPAALERAKHYRLLNDPGPAESICEDILAIDPGNQEANRIRLLSICDRLESAGSAGMRLALECARQLDSEYAREYYQGLVFERSARVALRQRMPQHMHTCYEHLQDAMAHYQRAEQIAPSSNDEALLRWNHCLRIMRANPALSPAPKEHYEPSMLE